MSRPRLARLQALGPQVRGGAVAARLDARGQDGFGAPSTPTGRRVPAQIPRALGVSLQCAHGVDQDLLNRIAMRRNSQEP